MSKRMQNLIQWPQVSWSLFIAIIGENWVVPNAIHLGLILEGLIAEARLNASEVVQISL
jgi:hypothetical protein